MKKGIIFFFIAAAVIFLVLSMHCMHSVDVLELQHMGISYRDALKMEAESHTTAHGMAFMSVLCCAFACVVPRMMR